MKSYDIKGIILGIGIGLVLSSIINININSRALTDDFIKTEASKKGFIIVNPKDLIDKGETSEKNSTYEGEKINEDSDEMEEIGEVEIKVSKGYDSYKTADVLAEHGLIDDKNGFMDRLYKRGKDDKIQYGSFILKKGMSYDDIIDVITKPKKQ
ncbi:hypothetical protein [Lutispora sp.]|uniref:hypothetical protein n=1 Tax=Lutispora sp. TaxID=2828727 RepID=UPI000EC664AD|nr:hypothetical protein [Lutispora sp.]MEA4962734.1 hypothetical protein [Lutispora sp.]HCJ56413.1 hypothetical protein [Clostridiaceae bacterium]